MDGYSHGYGHPYPYPYLQVLTLTTHSARPYPCRCLHIDKVNCIGFINDTQSSCRLDGGSLSRQLSFLYYLLQVHVIIHITCTISDIILFQGCMPLTQTIGFCPDPDNWKHYCRLLYSLLSQTTLSSYVQEEVGLLMKQKEGKEQETCTLKVHMAVGEPALLLSFNT